MWLKGSVRTCTAVDEKRRDENYTVLLRTEHLLKREFLILIHTRAELNCTVLGTLYHGGYLPYSPESSAQLLCGGRQARVYRWMMMLMSFVFVMQVLHGKGVVSMWIAQQLLLYKKYPLVQV